MISCRFGQRQRPLSLRSVLPRLAFTGLASLLALGCGGEPEQAGTIDVGSLSNFPSTSAVGALFRAEGQPWEDDESACTTVYGDCEIEACADAAAPTDPAPLTYLAAGIIDLRSDSFLATGVPSGSYGGYDFDQTGFPAAGETITVTASGGTVSAFERTLTMPAPPVLTSPVLLTAPRDQDLELTWQTLDTDEIVLFSSLPSTPLVDRRSAGCTFRAEAGRGVVPTAFLQALPAGATFTFAAIAKEIVPTPEGAVHLRAYVDLVEADGVGFPTIELE